MKQTFFVLYLYFVFRVFSFAYNYIWWMTVFSGTNTLCLKLLCKNMLYTLHHAEKSGMQNIDLFTIGSTKM